MQRVATMTVIRAQNVDQATINGVVMPEMARLNARLSACRAEIEATQIHRNRLLADRLEGVRNMTRRRGPRWARRTLDRIILVWSILCMLAQEGGLIELPAVGETLMDQGA